MTNFNSSFRSQGLHDQQGFRLASYLNLAEMPHDMSEHLRLARQRALAVRKQAPISVPAMMGANSMGWQSEDPASWRDRIGSVIPLLALVGGLLLVNSIQDDSRARELAEVDLALLTDELPVAAFADPGFLQFLKTEN
jgi:hypothetical protein